MDRSPFLRGRSVFVGRCVPPQTRHLIGTSSACRTDYLWIPRHRVTAQPRDLDNRQPTTRRESRRKSCTITIRGASNRRTHIMRFDLQDVALRTLILVAGGLAALLLALKGQGQALPALAVGGTLGACVMARFGPRES